MRSPKNLGERFTNFCLKREGYFNKFLTHVGCAHLNLND